jgi:hypothetical protein
MGLLPSWGRVLPRSGRRNLGFGSAEWTARWQRTCNYFIGNGFYSLWGSGTHPAMLGCVLLPPMISELKYAFRQFAKAPAFTVVALLSLAIGIGATTTVFCWIHNIVLNPLPGTRDQQRLAVLVSKDDSQQIDTVSIPDLTDARSLTDIFDGVIGSQITPANLAVDGHSEWIYGQIATANFFSVLGVQPLLGRTFLPDEDLKLNGNPVLILSESFWRRRFNGDPSIIGKTVQINLHPFTIVGITPADFRGTMSGLVCDFWAPVSMHQAVATFGGEMRHDRWLHTQARLRPGVTLEHAQIALDTFSARLAKAYPESTPTSRSTSFPFPGPPMARSRSSRGSSAS